MTKRSTKRATKHVTKRLTERVTKRVENVEIQGICRICLWKCCEFVMNRRWKSMLKNV